MVNRLTKILGLAIIGTFLISSKVGLEKQRNENDRLYGTVLLKADINEDSMVDHSEWAGVYKSLGSIYDINSNPKEDLSSKDMRKYVD